ncbi:MAG: CidA/LrgA family protein [Colwellia sp.]|uniref:CidA/LrgA family protein n=1 Tax=Colwellia sp. TaxID=56799 RepID=UPI001DB56379|nr:CidA/LrgA family protein [Colwellia sp.]NQY50254.1 CidA/LrgA family protein [Colwellia sp.]
MRKLSAKIIPKLVSKLKKLKLISLGFCQIFLYLLIGELLSTLIPLPPAIIGLIACCGACLLLQKVPESLDIASSFLLKNMAIFFIPYVVTITLFWPALADYWLACLLALFISTLITLSLTSIVSDKLIERAVQESTKRSINHAAMDDKK